MWVPQIEQSSKPKYLAFVDAIEEAIRSGKLKVGEQLLNQRELAAAIGFTNATMTKAVGEAVRRGLLTARTGSGTFVNSLAKESETWSVVDFGLNIVPDGIAAPYLQRSLAASAPDALQSAFGYSHKGSEQQRDAWCNWLKLRHMNISSSALILTYGAQHGLLSCFIALTKPGQVILCERWIYSGIKRFAQMTQTQLIPVETDKEGLLPEALERRLAETKAGIIICSASGQNPTTSLMSDDRRSQITRICSKAGCVIIEDDAGGHLTGDSLPPLYEFDRGNVIYISSLSKSIITGFRLGVVCADERFLSAIRHASFGLQFTAPTVYAELFSEMVNSGAANDCLVAHQNNANTMLTVAAQTLGADHIPQTFSYHLWLPVGPKWNAESLTSELLAQGVRVAPGDMFEVSDIGQSPQFIRLCFGTVRSMTELERGVKTIQRVMTGERRLNILA